MRPRYSLSAACAASSTTGTPSAWIGSRSAGWPYRCTGMIAFVRGVTSSATRSGSTFRSESRTSAKTGVAPVWTITFAVAGHVIGVVITSSPGPIAERDQREVHRRRSRRRPRARASRPTYSREAFLELGRARAGRQPAGADRLRDGGDLLVADRRRLEAEEGLAPRRQLRHRWSRRRTSASTESALASTSLRDEADGEHGSHAVARRGEADRRPHPARGRAGPIRLLPPRSPPRRRARRPPRRAAERGTARTPAGLTLDGPQLLVVDRLARARPRSRVRSGRRRAPASQSSASWPPPRRAASSTDVRTTLTDDDLRVASARRALRRLRRPRARRRPPPRPARARASSATRARARRRTPAARRRPRSVTVSGVNRPSTENAFTVTSRPGTSSSTSTTFDRDSPSASANAVRQLALVARRARAPSGPGGRAP